MTDDNNPVLIDIDIPIETARLYLRPLQAGDGAALNDAKRETWDQLVQWMDWAFGDPGTVDEDEAFARDKHARFLLREDLLLAGFCQETDRLILMTGLHRFCWRKRVSETG